MLPAKAVNPFFDSLYKCVSLCLSACVCVHVLMKGVYRRQWKLYTEDLDSPLYTPLALLSALSIPLSLNTTNIRQTFEQR